MNKAVSYLRWVRNKFRINNCEVKPADIFELKLWKQSFGCQKNENKFIIGKHVVKWKRYAEVIINEKIAITDGFGRKKKRNRIMTLFSCVQKFNYYVKNERGKVV
jgi:hypothetical protein